MFCATPQALVVKPVKLKRQFPVACASPSNDHVFFT
jgi:hypothetical protein